MIIQKIFSIHFSIYKVVQFFFLKRIQEEFVQNENLSKDLEESVEKYRTLGQADLAGRLDQKLNVKKKTFAELNQKLKKFQKPADFDQKLNKVKKLLDEIEQALYTIEINSEDSDTIHIQLEHCMVNLKKTYAFQIFHMII